MSSEKNARKSSVTVSPCHWEVKKFRVQETSVIHAVSLLQ